MLFMLFLSCGAGYPALTASPAGYRALQVRGPQMLSARAALNDWGRSQPQPLATPNQHFPTPNPGVRTPPNQALYFLSSFFNQAGPNSTTWLVAAEVFPTDVRATFQVRLGQEAHGSSKPLRCLS